MRTVPHLLFTSLLFSFLFLPAKADELMRIGGRHVFVDTLSNIFLCSIPEALFDTDTTLTVSLQEPWQQITIDGQTLTDSCYTFHNITANHTWQVTLLSDQGQQLQGNLQFTFLPIVQLIGNFGYDYQEGQLLLAHPDSIPSPPSSLLLPPSSFTASIKWRGGTTNTDSKHKRNYKVKFPADISLLGMRNDNNWMLDAGQPDVFRLRNRIAMDLWNDFATPPYHADQKPKARNGVSGKIVELFLNNEYRGIYNLSEMIDRKQLKLKKVNEQTGQIHGCLYKGVSWNHTQMFEFFEDYDNTKESFWGFEVKYPDLNDADTTDWTPLIEASNFALQSSDQQFENHIADYFDIPVLVDYSIFVSIVNAVDNSGKNTYWAIYDKTADKRLTPTPWDLDATFGQRWGGRLSSGDNDHATPYYITDVDVNVFFRLYKNNVLQFNDLMNERYQQLHQPGGVLSTDSIISRFTYYYKAIKNSGAAQRETNKWNGDSDVWGDTIDFDREYRYICNWIRKHMDIINKMTFPLFYNKEFFDLLDIASPNTQLSTVNHQLSTIYNLNGQKVSNSQLSNAKLNRGIYIRNGKKFVVTHY